jgi:putative NADH-flavin reductase
MKIAVYGATGNIGTRIVAEALHRGHEITGVARAERPVAEGATFVVGDAADSAQVGQITAAHDVVVSSLAPHEGEQPFVDALLTLAEQAIATRLIVVGGAGSLIDESGTRLVDDPEFPAAWKTGALAQARALDELRSVGPDVDWTYLSPAPLTTAGERTGKYLTAIDVPAGERISYEDLAVAILDEIENPEHRRQRFTVAN